MDVVAPGCSSPARTPLMPPAGDLEGDSEGSLSEIPTPHRPSFHPLHARIELVGVHVVVSVKSSSSRMIRWGMSSPWALLRTRPTFQAAERVRDGELLQRRLPQHVQQLLNSVGHIEVFRLEVLDDGLGCAMEFLPYAGRCKFSVALLQRTFIPLAARCKGVQTSWGHRPILGRPFALAIRARTGSSPRPNQLLR